MATGLIINLIWFGMRAGDFGRNRFGWAFVGALLFFTINIFMQSIVVVILKTLSYSNHNPFLVCSTILAIALTFTLGFLISPSSPPLPRIKCPECGRMNQGGTWHCRCGHEFKDQTETQSPAKEDKENDVAYPESKFITGKPHDNTGLAIKISALIALIGIIAGIFLPPMAAKTPLNTSAYLMIFPAVAIAVFHYFLGVAVINHKNWARIAGIILGILWLSQPPIGTIIYSYILYNLIWRWEPQKT